MKKAVIAAASVIVISAMPASGTAQASVVVDQQAPAGPNSLLPSATMIWVTPREEVSSSTLREGSVFDVVVSRDVLLGDYMVIPRGTPGHARISWRTGRGVYGKSAKMEIDLTDVVVGGSVVPLSGHYRVAGKGNTAATIGVGIAAGVIVAAVVTGHSATVPQNTEWKAYTLAPVQVAYNMKGAPEPGVSPYDQGRRLGRSLLLASAAN